MIFSRTAVVSVLSLLALGIEGFSPSSPSSASIAQMVQDSQRYQPRTMSSLSEQMGEDDEMPDIDSPPADDYIVNVGEMESEDETTGIEDDGEPPAWAALEERMAEQRSKHRLHENDTGSPEFQVAGMTERIAYLTKHLQQHPKDFSTRRGLVALVNKRRRLLNYLVKADEKRYVDLINGLGIRHKPASRVKDREEQYSRFPKQKAVKKHLLKKKK
mmetsp:Transcript_23073/g.66237  ORF Transcript_23073/g.66237 Transcript_23073/m.66237 type:complete len:216 (+) Transcript_23073:161-808(+)|eukprot:CAMPEP_0176071288 /NCGR_PEP_ID=MMETSP0120_2-20121206/35605_1 /TAXON_ID=160619 /ORGANISM="Kryptoperidinium foliaceum, Strain CCMP 1326" /LENGTH=215 /DNA_ID=CAMNT_0017404943 /DNA_START=103 /DNA_END=750 /DNA_ORIENTATION=-